MALNGLAEADDRSRAVDDSAGCGARRRLRPLVRRLRGTARTSHRRASLSELLGCDSSPDTASVPDLRRSTCYVARDRHSIGEMSALSAPQVVDRASSGNRHLRRTASRNRARSEIRRPTVSRSTVGRHDARPLLRGARRFVLCRAGSTPFLPPARARFQSSCRSCQVPRSARVQSVTASSRHTITGGATSRQAASKRSGRVRPNSYGAATSGEDRGACRRRLHDRRDIGGLCTSAQSCWGCAGSRPYGRSSRDITALMTSSAIACLERSPSSTIHSSAAA